jgi:hypothetical protein
MSATFAMGRVTAAPLHFKAKFVAVLCLLSVLTAAFAEMFVHSKLGIAGALVAVLAMFALTLLCHELSYPLNRNLALLAVIFNLVGLTFEVLQSQPHGTNIAVVFNGFFCILVGCLAFRSTFASRILGALMMLGGSGWLTFLSAPLANYLSPYNLAFGLLGEGSVCLWILLMAVNARGVEGT